MQHQQSLDIDTNTPKVIQHSKLRPKTPKHNNIFNIDHTFFNRDKQDKFEESISKTIVKEFIQDKSDSNIQKMTSNRMLVTLLSKDMRHNDEDINKMIEMKRKSRSPIT